MVTAADIIRAPLSCALREELRGGLAVIGNLDGVHPGHQALVKEGVKLAAAQQATPAVVVFDPHPRSAFDPETPPFLLTRTETKAQILGQLGIKWLFVLPFVQELYTQTPETFVKHTLREILGLKGLLTGTDFKFGAGRSGDADALARLAAEVGMAAHAIHPVIAPGGLKYSSSSVRQALREGKPEDAAKLLGRDFLIRGEVIEGRKLARTLNFPTANIPLGPYVRPHYGVYVVSAVDDDKRHPGIANIGVRPTVDGETELLEVHLLDYEGDLYGQTLDIELHAFLRPEQKFVGLEALKAQIAEDVGRARAWHAQA